VGAQQFAATLLLLAAVSACARPARSGSATPYTPRARELTVTTVPLLVREARTVYPFLAADFARGGVLEGKEVYAFSPSTLTVVEGDTVHFTFINPEDDEHWFFLPDCTEEDKESFVLPECAMRLPPQTETHATYIARHAGIYPFMCIVVKHVPMMHGQLVVLSPAAVTARSGRGE
jgi:plastocyanin